MFTMPELMVAAEHNMPLPVIVWDNGGYKQIRDDMDDRNIPRIGVEGMRPDFELLAKACHCDFIAPKDADSFTTGLTHALAASRPTLIHICENDDWLCE
jgi:thiamine pyrophosphate-dependent acetolactate synthase large subunit-like protein